MAVALKDFSENSATIVEEADPMNTPVNMRKVHTKTASKTVLTKTKAGATIPHPIKPSISNSFLLFPLIIHLPTKKDTTKHTI